MKILLIGPQGSGKSTQADFLAKSFNVPKISTGDIFRELMREDSKEGKRLKEILASGKLVDDQTTSEIVKERVIQEDCRNGFIMDGYPRTVEQLNMFDPEFNKVIYLNVEKMEVVKRLLARGRADDTEELINKRLDLYYLQTQPLIDYYAQKGILVEVDGMGDIKGIKDEIKKQI